MGFFALLKREFITQLRRKKTLGLLLLITLGIFFCILDLWPSSGSNIQTSARRAQELLMIISLFVGGGAVLFVPGIAATTLISEREQNSWDMLSLTLIGPWKIVCAKLICSVGVYLLLIIGVAPFATSVFFIVGVDLFYVFYTYYIIVLGIITFASLGLMASAYQRTTTRAITHSYFYAAANLGLGYCIVFVCYAIVLMFLNPSISRISQLESAVNIPISFSTVVMFISSVDAFRGNMTSRYTVLFGYHTLMQLSTILLALYLTKRRITRPTDNVVASTKVKPTTNKIKWYRPTSAFIPIPTKMNPLRFREIRFGIAIKRKNYWAVLILMLFVSSMSAYSHFRLGMRMKEIFALTFCINLGLLTLFTLTSMANIFTKEAELKNLDMLKMTLLTPRAIVWG